MFTDTAQAEAIDANVIAVATNRQIKTRECITEGNLRGHLFKVASKVNSLFRYGKP
jgi:hypothetical protein